MTTRPVSIAQIVTGTAAAVALLYFLRGILVPLVMAFVLAVLVSALVRAIDRRWSRAPRWAVSALAGMLVIAAAAAAIFVLAQGGVEMVEQGPALVARLEGLIQNLGRSFGLDEPLRLSTLIGEISVPQLAGFVLASVQALVSAVFLMIVYFGFMLAARRRLGRKLRNVVKSSARASSLKQAAEGIATDIETYVWVQTLTGVMLAGSAGLVMIALGLDNAFFWTVVLFLLSFIPIIGVTIGSLAPSLFALLQFSTIWPAVAIFAGIQIAASIIGNVVYPRMQAETQNIDPVATLVSLSLWTFLWGLPGAFLAVPMTLMLMMVFAHFESTRWVTILLSHDGDPKLPEPFANAHDH